MEPISHLVKVSLPNYLSGLPIPDSIGGWFKLGVRDWISLIPPTALVAGVGYMAYQTWCPEAKTKIALRAKVNHKIKKDVAKVVDMVDVEDITEKTVFCRCWRSENWPYCDGAHGPHNQSSCDNVGPLVINKKK
ncbi:CDGSH iron-sulfur domain-containing protein 2 homolog [Diachasmimorpha longicaudata]